MRASREFVWPGVLIRTIACVFAAMVAVVIGNAFGDAASALAVVGLGAVVGLAAFRGSLAIPVLALPPVAGFVGSALTSGPGEYNGVSVLVVAAVLGLGLSRRWHRTSAALPPRLVIVVLVGYLLAAAVSTGLSIDHATSIKYLVGMVGLVVMAFVVAPAVLGDAERRLVVVSIVATATIGAAASLILWTTGPVSILGRQLGVYLPTEITIRGSGTGLIVPQVTGIFGTPGYLALETAIGLVALLAVKPRKPTWTLGPLAALLVVLLLTETRTAWIAFLFGVVVLAVARVRSRTRDRTLLAVGATMVVLTLALLVGPLGARARYDVAADRYGIKPATGLLEAGGSGAKLDLSAGRIRQSKNVDSRGGFSSPSRVVLWSASLSALKKRPLFGYGPGTNSDAIAPELTGTASRYSGLTSHDTWFRSGVELGVVGLAMLLLFTLVTGALIGRSVFGRGKARDASFIPMAACVATVLGGSFTATFLLGGLIFASVCWVLCSALAVVESSAPPPTTPVVRRVRTDRQNGGARVPAAPD
jgi:O-Antigen ligase